MQLEDEHDSEEKVPFALPAGDNDDKDNYEDEKEDESECKDVPGTEDAGNTDENQGDSRDTPSTSSTTSDTPSTPSTTNMQVLPLSTL